MSTSNPQNGSADKKHWLDDVLGHPLLWGALTLIAFAFGFTPKGSTLASVICLVLAWILFTRMVYTFSTVRTKPSSQRLKVTGIASLISLIVIASFGWWLMPSSTPTVSESSATEVQPRSVASPSPSVVLNSAPSPSPQSTPKTASPVPSPTATAAPPAVEINFNQKVSLKGGSAQSLSAVLKESDYLGPMFLQELMICNSAYNTNDLYIGQSDVSNKNGKPLRPGQCYPESDAPKRDSFDATQIYLFTSSTCNVIIKLRSLK